MTQSEQPIVDTKLGKLKGFVKDDTQTFLGIQYGKSTAGERRFMPPEPPEPWQGVIDACDFGPICPQGGSLADNALADNQVIGPLPKLPLSEDCLYLNVWTPAVKDHGKRPVLFWLHGRGFAEGAGSEGWYDGTKLSQRGDVVVVTINHRLNIFGYLYLAELGGEKYATSGVNGMLDAVLALEWVRDNIAEFGGDPDNVTIFGESGGGLKVGTLMALPRAEGLFHKAVMQSGPGLRGVDPKLATPFARKVLEHFDIKKEELHKLHDLTSEQLLDAVTKLAGIGPGASGFLAPVVDGKVYPRHAFIPDAVPTAVNIPLIIGTNKDESALFSAADPKRVSFDEEELHRRLDRLLGERKTEILDVYRQNRPRVTPWDLYIGIISESMRLWSIQLAEKKAAAGGAPVYMYLFTWESNYMGGIFKSCHAMEIPFVFNNPDIAPFTGKGNDRHELAASMSQSWINFARSGDPNVQGLPHWPPYDTENRTTMIFDTPCRVENDPRKEERQVWKGKPLLRT
ncbi:MAG: carboxylesterase/lipase family protein [Desulfobacteraceae bacterium]|nr:carboxylesterase/lipase family protein [Desulfobacteraceae bacterium]MBU4053038.1 carboxylesterase/lipase family protein [Pseudomonadota bacterium]